MLACGIERSAQGATLGLRPDAPAELDRADRLAASLGVEFGRTNLRVPCGANLQARARHERYAALRRAAKDVGASYIATAHHADARAETVVMRVMRGSGPAGLAELAPKAGELNRPIIRASRLDILAHLERRQIAYSEDPSNRDSRFLRTQVRFELLPHLLRYAPGIVGHLNALADRMLEIAPDCQPNSTGLSRRQAEELKRLLHHRRDRAEIALDGGWVMKFEKRKLRHSD